MSQVEPQTQAPDAADRAEQLQPAIAESEAKLGPVQRLFGVLISPGETFADINRKPTWLAPMIIAVLIGAGFLTFLNWRVNPDWNRITRDTIRQRVNKTGAQMPPETAIEQQVKIAQFVGKVLPVFAIFAPIAYLVVAGLFALGMMLMQAQTSFKKILSVVTWTLCGVGLVSAVVNAASLMVRDRASLDTINPSDAGSISATNLSVVLASNASPVLKAIASSVDIFTIWNLILLSIGLAAVAGSRKIKTGKTGVLVVGLWLLWVAFSVLAAMFRG